MRSSAAAFLRFLRDLPRFLEVAGTFEQSRTVLAQALSCREESFLRMLRRCVYANPGSPYRPLLRRAGLGYAEVEAATRRDGLDATLAGLKAAGVWVAFDDFKSASNDFGNHALSSACEASSGGSSGRGVRIHLDLEHLAFRTHYDQLFFQMLDLREVPLAVWYPKLPAATGVGNCLRYAKMGHPPARWFALPSPEGRVGDRLLALATHAIVGASRLSPHPLPAPEALGLDEVGTALDWILLALRRAGRCVFQSYVSQAVRIAQAARARGADLTGVLFIVGSEPLTASKHQSIEASGARVYARYFATELGTIGIGCGDPRGAGDYHLATPSVAAIADSQSLLFTSLLDSAPKILINVQLGDNGILEERPCGCLAGELGLSTHVSQIASFERATGEGMTVGFRELARVIEDGLVPRYGGSALDYQWVEREDASCLTRLLLRISPERGTIDEAALVATVLECLRRGNAGLPLAAALWQRAGTIQILRERPRSTGMGKTASVVREESSS